MEHRIEVELGASDTMRIPSSRDVRPLACLFDLPVAFPARFLLGVDIDTPRIPERSLPESRNSHGHSLDVTLCTC